MLSRIVDAALGQQGDMKHRQSSRPHSAVTGDQCKGKSGELAPLSFVDRKAGAGQVGGCSSCTYISPVRWKSKELAGWPVGRGGFGGFIDLSTCGLRMERLVD